MLGMSLVAPREELLTALKVLVSHRRRRFSAIVPVWLVFDRQDSELGVAEDRGRVLAAVPATGSWPPMGATVSLLALRRIVEKLTDDNIELIAAHEAVYVLTPNGSVKFDLLPFGQEGIHAADNASEVILHAPLSDLPLFRWASRNNA